MRKLLIALLLLLLGGGSAVGIDKLAGTSLKFEAPTISIKYASSTAGQIVEFNYDRQFLRIDNIGTTTVYLRFGTSTDFLTASNGIPVYYASSTNHFTFYEMNPVNLYFGSVQVIAGNDAKLFITEK